MSPLRLTGSTSGYSQIDAPAVAGDQTFTLPGTGGTIVTTAGTQTLTNKTLQGGAITSGTAVASTSGTSIDFTGIPSWVKRITVTFQGVSTSGSSFKQIQLGISSGVTTTGYSTFSSQITGSTVDGASYTSGFVIREFTAANTNGGQITFSLANASTNLWVGTGLFISSGSLTYTAGGTVALSGTLDRVRITTVNGTDTFDAGNVNILYEG